MLLGVVLGLVPAAALRAAPGDVDVPDSQEAAPVRAGLLRVGSFYLTPYLQIGAVGLDTNVFYTPTERRTDFSASGGPGLDLVLPVGRRSRFRLDGAADYLYFARTASQRRLNGHGSALLELHGVKTDLTIEERYAKAYSRPNYEVNARVQREEEGTRAFVRRTLGERMALALFGERARSRAETTEYLGTDLGATLSQDRFQAGGELRLALSIKTRFVAGGEQTWYRFPRLGQRDGRSALAYAGLRTDATALIAGEALAGMRWFRLDSGARREGVYASLEATWNISPRTKLGGRLSRDLTYSSFSTSGQTPTNWVERAELFLDKMLSRTLYLRLFGRGERLRSDGEVTIIEGSLPVSALRRDEIREAGGELGYQFRSRVRIGLTAFYTERTSPFTTFGVRGLLAGATVRYSPPQPSFR